MSKVRLTGSNSGYVEIAAVADAGNLTFTMPTSGTALLGNNNNVFSGITTTGQLDINGSIDVSTDIVGGRNLKVTGITTLSDDVTLTGGSYNVVWDKSDNALEFGDNAKLAIGSGTDLLIYHDGNNSLIRSGGTGQLQIESSNNTSIVMGNAGLSETIFKGSVNGAVELYFNNSKKIETTNTGAVVTGICTATSFSGSGEGLTRTTQYAYRNRFHNGGMTIAQRIGNTETTLTHNNWTQILDRWKCYENTDATITATRVHNTYPTAGTIPSSYSATRLKVTGTDTNLTSSQQVQFSQIIEGFNWQDLRWGTSAAKSVTVSFHILATGSSASNVTGTYCLQCSDAGTYSRAYIREYTIDAINVWKRVTLTFPGDTGGNWNSNNFSGTNEGCRFSWFLAGDTNQFGSANTWSSYKTSTSNQKNFLAHVNNMIFITDVQVEEGTVATPFETKPFSTELQLCQRYYQDIPANNAVYVPQAGSYARINVLFPTTMKSTPSVTLTPSWDGGAATPFGCMFYKNGNNTMPRMQCSSEF